MNSLQEEFDVVAHHGGRGVAERLRSPEARERLARRVRRGRMVRDVSVGAGSVAAVTLVAAAAIAMSRVGGIQPAATSGAPSVPATASPGPVFALEPAPEPTAGVVTQGSEWILAGDPTCEAFAAQPESWTRPEIAPPMPIPSILETGRLYGWGDDVLVGGYPQPVPLDALGPVEVDSSEQTTIMVHLKAADGRVWVFSLELSMRDDLPHDAPGLFASLSPLYECSADGPIPPGRYEARVGFSNGAGSSVIVQVSDITVVEGVPSVPEVHAQG